MTNSELESAIKRGIRDGVAAWRRERDADTGTVERLAADDALAKAIANFGPALERRVREAVKAPTPDRPAPVAVVKRMSTGAEDQLRRDAEHMDGLAKAIGGDAGLTASADMRRSQADAVTEIKKALGRGRPISLPELLTGEVPVSAPDRTAALTAELDAARAAGQWLRAEALQQALAVEVIRQAMQRPLPWVQPPGSAPPEAGTPATAGAIRPERAGVELLGSEK